ncbi:MAG: hypothetical protein Q7U54_17885 [Bacteroidales bacterium]|nr:hypothetical protein [Bacteroidales bacterium]
MELTKKEKKTAREVIETGLQKEFAKGLFDADTILTKWKNKRLDNREAYHSLYKQITGFDKHIARRYDDMTGSKYLFIVAAQLRDGIISENDLNEFSPEAKQAILRISSL